MPGALFEKTTPNAKLIQRLLGRDAALWIGSRDVASPADIEAIAALAELPWALVFLETTSEKVALAIQERANSNERLIRIRGYAHVIASDPADVALPPRSLPILLLNGRTDGTGPDSTALGPRASQRRRLNQLARLAAIKPAEMLVIPNGDAELLSDLREVWTEDLRSLVSVVSTDQADRDFLGAWLLGQPSPPAVDLYTFDLPTFRTQVEAALQDKYSPERLIIKVRDDAGPQDLDITGCELIEHPLLDRYELLQSRDLVLLQPEELSLEDLGGFFHRADSSWRPYAAGVPWRREQNAYRRVNAALIEAHTTGATANQLFIIASEPGAGGSTLARDIAYAASVEGFPALVARPSLFRPSLTEVESFLLRVLRLSEARAQRETPWLIVFDAAHWEGQEQELLSFHTHLSRRGRPAVVLAVVSDRIAEQLENATPTGPIATLRHVMEREEALKLGEHLNRFLKPHGRTKSPAQWLNFWEEHRPSIDTPIAAFWIALEFWLKGILDLQQSVQQWLYRQFIDLNISDDLRMLLLQIAALTIERRPLPEGLMPLSKDMALPFSVLLDDVRGDAPGLGLARDTSGAHGRWALAHTLLGRYLLNSTYFDRQLCDRLRLGEAKNPTHLRLLLLQRIVQRPEISHVEFRELALDFAVRIFKLDPGGSAEFFPLWREVFEVLDTVPSTLRNTSRTFLHHIAISCRRVATGENYFDVTSEEREHLLRAAVTHLEFALQLPRSEESERDLNLLNSLALAYQNLAETRRIAGAPDGEIDALREKASEATIRAQQEDPLNPYVLETSAKNLLQSASLDSERRVVDAARAMSFIYEAISRNRSTARVGQLARLLRQAVEMLEEKKARATLEQLRKSGSSLAFVALAWLELSDGLQVANVEDLRVSPEKAGRALSVLEQASGQRDRLWLKLRYDLLAIAKPLDFTEQLVVLEELEGTSFQMPFQYQLEYAILLYQIGRHLDGRMRFRALRRALREHDAIVEVPSRMRWLLTHDRSARLVCDARVQDTTGFKFRARVRDLGNDDVPFTPQDFGQRSFVANQPLKVTINFGPMGPFAKPPSTERAG